MVSSRGISLIENLIAILLLAIIVTSGFLALSSSRMYVLTARHHYQGINLARERLEDIISGGDASLGVTAVAVDPATGLNGNLTVSYPVAGTIDVSVTWNDGLWGNIASQETIVMRLP